MQHLLFSRRKLLVCDKKQLEDILTNTAYAVCTIVMTQWRSYTNLHISNPTVSIYCSGEHIETSVPEDHYPQCPECSNKRQISK